VGKRVRREGTEEVAVWASDYHQREDILGVASGSRFRKDSKGDGRQDGALVEIEGSDGGTSKLPPRKIAVDFFGFDYQPVRYLSSLP